MTAKKKTGNIRPDKSKSISKGLIKLPNWVYYVIFALFSVIFFWGQLSGDTFFWEDFTEFVYPTQNYAAVEFANGEIPFWNPYSFSGMPFLADLQVGFFYPPNRLLSFFVTDGKLPVWALQFMIILHFFFAQLSMYLLARQLKISQIGAAISAVSYTFSLILVCHVIHPMIIYHLTWLPLALKFYFAAYESNSYRNSAWSGLILGISFLSGHPQLTLYEMLLFGLLYIWQIFWKIKEKSNQLRTLIIAGILPFIIAPGIYAIQLLPSQELAGYSQRAEMTYETASEGSLEFSQLFTSITPKLFGYIDPDGKDAVPYYLQINDNKSGAKVTAPYYNFWESAFYFGLIALFLGSITMMSNYKDKNVMFFIFIAVFGFLFALGSNGFIFPLFYKLPFFGSFRNPSRLMLFFALAFTVLSGMGYDIIISKSKSIFKYVIISGIVILLFALLIATGLLPSILNAPENYLSNIKGFGISALIFIVLTLILIAVLLKTSFNPLILGSILLVIVFIDLYMAGSFFNSSKINPADQYKLDESMVEAFRANPPNDIFRVNMRMYQPVSYQAMKRNQGMIDRIMLIEGYNPLILKRVMPPIDSRDTVNSLYNVKYEIGITEQNRPNFYQRDFRYQNARLVSNAVISDENSIEKLMRESGFDYSNTVVLEKDPGIKLNLDADQSNSSVKCIKYSGNEIIYEVDAESNAVLSLSEIYYPAWKAVVDDKDTEILRANYCFRAIPIEKGKHTVRLYYESSLYTLGKWVTLFTFLFAAIIIGITGRRKVNSKEVNN